MDHREGDVLLLNTDEAARLLRASRSKLYRLMRAGEIVGHRVGGTYLFYRHELLAYVDSCALRATPVRS